MKNFFDLLKLRFMSSFKTVEEFEQFKRRYKLIAICFVVFTVCMGVGACVAKNAHAEEVSSDVFIVDSLPKFNLTDSSRLDLVTLNVDSNSFMSDSLLNYFKGIFVKQTDYDSYFVFTELQNSSSSNFRVYHLVLFNKLDQNSRFPCTILNCLDLRLYHYYSSSVGYLLRQYDIRELGLTGYFTTCFTNYPDSEYIPCWSDYWFMNHNLLWFKVVASTLVFFLLLWFGMQFIKKRWYV